MQRQLLQISDRIPDDILLTLLKCFAQILSREPEPASQACGPFIRAFAKIRDDGSEKQFQAIIEEDENGTHNEDDNDCTFNYKVSNVVTQEVVYSMGDEKREEDEENKIIRYGLNGEIIEVPHCSHDDDHELPPLVDPDTEIKIEDGEAIEKNFDEISKEIEADVEVNGENLESAVENSETAVENQENSAVSDENTQNATETSENPENPQQSNPESTETPLDDSEKPQAIDLEVQHEEQPSQEQREVPPLQKVTLDDIQREIHEMQMFLFNKGIAPETHKKKHHNDHHHKKLKKIEDSYKVDFCVNLNKKGSGDKKNSKSKAILANYLEGSHHGHHGKHSKSEKAKKAPIFDPSVPNTPEDFLKEKSVTEKINKKKQKIKHLDVSWQKLCDSKNKVYKHSNFKQLIDDMDEPLDQPTIN